MATTSSTSASSVSQGSSLAAVPQPTEAQQRVLERIAAQRDRLHARRAARMQAMALARHEQGLGGTDESLALRAAAFARETMAAPSNALDAAIRCCRVVANTPLASVICRRSSERFAEILRFRPSAMAAFRPHVRG